MFPTQTNQLLICIHSHADKDFEDIKKPLNQVITCGLGPEVPPFTAGEDAYTIMNPAGAACVSKEQAKHDQSPPRNPAGSRTPISSRLSLPLVSQRVDQQESERGDALNERYVRTSLLF